MTIRHYYHVYAVEGWESIVDEHLTAMIESGLADALGDDGFRVGVVGELAECDRVVAYCQERIPTRPVAIVTQGFEQVTLEAMRMWEMVWPDDSPVLYAHTKGVSDPSEINIAWRRSMETKLVREWRTCVAGLALNKDVSAVGCHWLTPDAYPDMVTIPFFGGNWWWAKASFIRTLGPLSIESRWEAEAWLGRGNPSVIDVLPGWPGFNIFVA